MMSNQLTMPFKQVLLQVKWFFIKLLNLFLVASVRAAHGDFSHAMILDNVRNSQFNFKNTYSNNTKFTIPVDAPKTCWSHDCSVDSNDCSWCCLVKGITIDFTKTICKVNSKIKILCDRKQKSFLLLRNEINVRSNNTQMIHFYWVKMSTLFCHVGRIWFLKGNIHSYEVKK